MYNTNLFIACAAQLFQFENDAALKSGVGFYALATGV